MAAFSNKQVDTYLDALPRYPIELNRKLGARTFEQKLARDFGTGNSQAVGVDVTDAKAMAEMPADLVGYPNSYSFVIDMPGIKSGDIKVEVQDDNVLVISAERKREKEGGKEGMQYLKLERRVGKFMKRFVLPKNAKVDGISAVCKDGVLTVTVERLPPPELKKPKTIEVKFG